MKKLINTEIYIPPGEGAMKSISEEKLGFAEIQTSKERNAVAEKQRKAAKCQNKWAEPGPFGYKNVVLFLLLLFLLEIFTKTKWEKKIS